MVSSPQLWVLQSVSGFQCIQFAVKYIQLVCSEWDSMGTQVNALLLKNQMKNISIEKKMVAIDWIQRLTQRVTPPITQSIGYLFVYIVFIESTNVKTYHKLSETND